MNTAPANAPKPSNTIGYILLDPKAQYDDPFDVVTDNDLSHEDSLRVLKAWREDAKALQRAAAENMTGGEESQLHRIQEAINALSTASQKRRPVRPTMAAPLGVPTAISPGLVETIDARPAPTAQPRSRKQLLGPDRKLIFRFIIGLLIIAGLFFMVFGPFIGPGGRVSTLGLGVIALEAIVLGVGIVWLLLVKTSKRKQAS